jgi:hypothetical protein
MGDDAPAKVYSDQRDLLIYLGDSGDGFTLPLKEKWRAPDAFAAVTGFVVTGAAVTANLNSGHALTILVGGAAITAATAWLASRLPHGRPSLATRARWWRQNLHPTVRCSHPRRR